MAYVPLPHFLFRAPLLPLRMLWDARANLLDHPLARTALDLASPELAAAAAAAQGADGAARDRRGAARVALALDRYRRRAAFRPTPHGLWAGVGVGTLAPRTRMASGTPTAQFRVSWKRLADLGRALLDDAQVRRHVRVRRAPSVLVGTHTVLWLAPGDDGLIEEKRADRDELLGSVLEATVTWTAWSAARAAVAGDAGPAPAADRTANHDHDHDHDSDGNDLDDIDDLLLTMVDDRLLHVDLVPPLIGPPPDEWMRQRLAHGALVDHAPAAAAAAAQLAVARQAAQDADCERLRTAVAALPGGGDDDSGGSAGIDATLLFPDSSSFTLAQAAVERAARLAPLLFRLQEALVPPASERVPGGMLADALDATTETFGTGALPMDALALGQFGVEVSERRDDRAGAASGGAAPPGPAPELLTFLVDALVDAARRNMAEVRWRAEDLEPLLPPAEPPPTCELFLTPARARTGSPPGEGWLLGLHAPAGATGGRFAFALGARGALLFDGLRAAEMRARPGEARLDVSFAPSDALADLCSHPPFRATALALTSWPAERQEALTVADLQLCANPAALEPLALRRRPSGVAEDATDAHAGSAVTPAALHRVRSALAPGGLWRLLVGWSLYRQHAPWAMTLGALDHLTRTPRLVVDGFVVAPASWKIPAEVTDFGARAGGGAEAADAAAARLRAWRKRVGVPRYVQVGSEDELLPVDLTAAGAAAELARHQRVFEIWPPVGDTPDASGRRVEAVVALVDEPTPEQRAHIQAAIAAAAATGTVLPPQHTAGPRRARDGGRWDTFKLFGAAERQDALLVGLVAPLVREAQAGGDVASWFFLRYEDGPGRRPHLRLRVRVLGSRQRFGRQLDQHLASARRGGDVVSVEQADYFPELARFGGAAVMPAIHALFQADSELACALLAAEVQVEGDGEDGDESAEGALVDDPVEQRLIHLVAAFDFLARGLGLDAAERQDCARRRRDAHAPLVAPEAARAHGHAFRALSAPLRAVLGGSHAGPVQQALRVYEHQARKAAGGLDRAQVKRALSPLLHLSAVRLMGLDRLAEIRAYDLWVRTLDSLKRHPTR